MQPRVLGSSCLSVTWVLLWRYFISDSQPLALAGTERTPCLLNQIEGPWPILGARQESLLSRVGPSKTSLREGEEGSHAGIGEGEVLGEDRECQLGFR